MSDIEPGYTRPASAARPSPPPAPRARGNSLGLFAATKLALRRWSNFSGRSRRREFWYFVLAVILIQVAVVVVHGLIFGPQVLAVTIPPGQTEPVATKVGYNGGIVNDVIGFLALTPLIAVGWRRLHDRNLRGWWLIVPPALLLAAGAALLISTFGFQALWNALRGGDPISVRMTGSRAAIIVLPVFAAYILVFIQLVRAGTTGPNRFGPDPREVTP